MAGAIRSVNARIINIGDKAPRTSQTCRRFEALNKDNLRNRSPSLPCRTACGGHGYGCAVLYCGVVWCVPEIPKTGERNEGEDRKCHKQGFQSSAAMKHEVKITLR